MTTLCTLRPTSLPGLVSEWTAFLPILHIPIRTLLFFYPFFFLLLLQLHSKSVSHLSRIEKGVLLEKSPGSPLKHSVILSPIGSRDKENHSVCRSLLYLIKHLLTLLFSRLIPVLIGPTAPRLLIINKVALSQFLLLQSPLANPLCRQLPNLHRNLQIQNHPPRQSLDMINTLMATSSALVSEKYWLLIRMTMDQA